MNLMLVRHGKTEDNEKLLYSGSSDKVLSEIGIKETMRLKEYIKGFKFDKLYCSPLKRAIDTAKIIYDGKMEIDDRLKELDFGIFEGLSFEEALEKYPDEMKRWNEDYINYKIPKGESLLDLYNRSIDFINSLDKSNDNILIVTHGGVIRCILCYVFENMNYFYKFQIDNSSLTVISFENGFSYIKHLNFKPWL